MYDLTIVNPTKDPFNTGTGINQACGVYIKGGAYINVGSGTVADFTSTVLNASGTFSVFGNTGDWSFDISDNSDGNWNISATFTGKGAPYSSSFTATCSQTGTSPNQLTFTDVSSETNLVLSQDNGSFITDGRIEMLLSTAPTAVYLDSNVS